MLIDVKTLDDNFCAKCAEFEVQQCRAVMYTDTPTTSPGVKTTYRCRWLDICLQRDKFLKERNSND